MGYGYSFVEQLWVPQHFHSQSGGVRWTHRVLRCVRILFRDVRSSVDGSRGRDLAVKPSCREQATLREVECFSLTADDRRAKTPMMQIDG